MTECTRRDFLVIGSKLAALMGLGSASAAPLAAAVRQLAGGNAPLLWLQAQSCSGCSVSLLNAEHPGPLEILTKYVSLKFHPTLSSATGKQSVDVIERTAEAGGHLLAVEGSIPGAMPAACRIDHRPLADIVASAAERAQAVVAVGTCAAFGGIPAAEGNPTGAVSLPEFLRSRGIEKPTIALPGCPCHPDWIVGTLAHVLSFGVPPLDAALRPLMFFETPLHDRCPRFRDYERERFAKTFSDEGCLFRLGCLGPTTHADCTVRPWNGGTSSCIRAGAPCIGCASPAFARDPGLPFYRMNEAPPHGGS